MNFNSPENWMYPGTSKNTLLIHEKLRKKGIIIFCNLPTFQHSILQLTDTLLKIIRIL